MNWLIVQALGGLATAAVDAWRGLEERSQRELDRLHTERLQAAQHQHERLLRRARSERRIVVTGTSAVQRPAHPLLESIRHDAEALSSHGLDIVVEQVGAGYGMALPLVDDSMVVFWFSEEYPRIAPLILLRSGSELSRIEYASNAWQPSDGVLPAYAALRSAFGELNAQ